MQLRDTRCGGKAAELARRIGKDGTYVHRLFYKIGKKGGKGLGLEILAACTKAFELPAGYWETIVETPPTTAGYVAPTLVDAPKVTDASGPSITPTTTVVTPAQTLFDLRRMLRNHTPTRRTMCADALRHLALDPDNDELSNELAALLATPLTQTNKQFAA